MVEHLDMALCLHIQRFLHRGAVHQYGHVAVQYIHLLLRVRHHAARRPDARHRDDDAAHEERRADDAHQLDFVFVQLWYLLGTVFEMEQLGCCTEPDWLAQRYLGSLPESCNSPSNLGLHDFYGDIA